VLDFKARLSRLLATQENTTPYFNPLSLLSSVFWFSACCDYRDEGKKKVNAKILKEAWNA